MLPSAFPRLFHRITTPACVPECPASLATRRYLYLTVTASWFPSTRVQLPGWLCRALQRCVASEELAAKDP